MADRAKTLVQIADTADELTEPHTHMEPVWDADQYRNKRMRRVYVTSQPGLLQALREVIVPTVLTESEGRAAGYRSAPPLCLEAVSRSAEIDIAAIRWCWELKIELRSCTESNIRALVGAAGAMDSDSQARLLADLRQWRSWSAVMSGWQSPAYAPKVACPVAECGKPNMIRINLARKTALCLACRATWDQATIGILADYIRTTMDSAAA